MHECVTGSELPKLCAIGSAGLGAHSRAASRNPGQGLSLHLQPWSHSSNAATSGARLIFPSQLFYRKVVPWDWISNFHAVWHWDCCLVLRLKGYVIFHHSSDYRKPRIQVAVPFCSVRLSALQSQGWYFLPVTRVSRWLAPSFLGCLWTLQEWENTSGEQECFDCRLEQGGIQVLLTGRI